MGKQSEGGLSDNSRFKSGPFPENSCFGVWVEGEVGDLSLSETKLRFI